MAHLNVADKIDDFRFRYRSEKSTDSFVSTKEVTAYSLMEFGKNSGETLAVNYLNVFLTLALGVEVGIIGTMMVIMTAIEIIRKPIISLLMDTTKTRWGRFRPYVIFFAPTSALLAILFFVNPFNSGDPNQIVYMYATYILYTTSSALFGTAWSGLQMCVTRDNTQKQKFYSFGQALSIVGTMLPSVLPVLVDIGKNSGNPSAIRIIFIVFGLILGGLGFFTCSMARNIQERIVIPKRESIFKNIKMVFKNKYELYFWLGNISNIFNKQAVTAGPYVFLYCYGAYSWQTLVWGFAGVAAWLMLFLSKPLFKMLSPKLVAILYNVIKSATLFALFFIGYGTSWTMIAALMVSHFVAALFEYVNTVATKLVNADRWDWFEWKYHVRNESTTGMVSGFVGQLVELLNGVIYTALFTSIGFKSGEPLHQSQQTMDGLFKIYCIWGGIACLLSTLPFLLFNLNKKKMAEIRSELEERRMLQMERERIERLEKDRILAESLKQMNFIKVAKKQKEEDEAFGIDDESFTYVEPIARGRRKNRDDEPFFDAKVIPE